MVPMPKASKPKPKAGAEKVVAEVRAFLKATAKQAKRAAKSEAFLTIVGAAIGSVVSSLAVRAITPTPPAPRRK